MRTLSKSIGISLFLIIGWEFSFAQGNNNNNGGNNGQAKTGSVLQPDIGYEKQDQTERRVIPPAYMREADVMYKERIWRVIDTRQKINEQLYYPLQENANRKSLFDLLKEGLMSGEISAYRFNPIDWDAYNEQLTLTEIKNIVVSVDSTTDENGNPTVTHDTITPDKIRGYMLKEDWYFDKQRSVLDPRILWICPLTVTINKNTHQEDPSAGNTDLFWINFPQIRPLLAKQLVFNQENDAEWRSFDDIFWKRQFSSYIVQQSNVFNRSIATYMKGLDALAEGNKIRDKIEALENNMWQY